MTTRLLATVLDSHTGGEPTRLVIEGAPELGRQSVAEQLKVLRREHDQFRRAVVLEPRGSDVLVGALLCPSEHAECVTGVIFFNNVGYLGMCGHGMIGVITSLAHLGRIGVGQHQVETPAGRVSAELHADGSVSITNVPSHREAAGVSVASADGRSVTGDIAWSGNWFYLVHDHGLVLQLDRVEELTQFAWEIRQNLNQQGHPLVDHIELTGPPVRPGAHSRNFVLCPGKAYDRSPCGTGTSAKLACLAAEGRLAEGEIWVQESILGSCFTGHYRWLDRAGGQIIPTISGRAHIVGKADLLIDPSDPFGWGIGGN